MTIKRTNNRTLAVAISAAMLAACSTTPERVPELEQARQSVASVRANPQAERYARTELTKAESALSKAEQALEDGADIELVRHDAYMAQGFADIAAARLGEEAAREQIEDAELERTRVLEQVRAQEAQLARAQAEEARMQADFATERAEQLQSELANLKAEETERGLVLTLGDVLFDTNEAQLKPGASSTIRRLAEFLDEYPDRRLLIEGHTDSRGTYEYNRELSSMRAEAVRSALMAEGVSAERLKAQGLGEQYPVASNDTSAGRQENRRVDIIVSSQGERGFPDAMDASPLRND